MAVFDKNTQLTVGNQTYFVNDLAQKLSNVPSDQVVNVFKEVGINLPRKIRMGILRRLLRPYVEQTRKEKESIADEFSYRLSQFESFTDSQLVNLLEVYKDDKLVQDYYYNFWLNILTYLVEKGIADVDFQKLIDIINENTTNQLEDSKTFNQKFNVVFYDAPGEIDGLTPEQFRPVTYKSTTLGELRAIGDKFNASVPKRLKKQELLQIVLKELKDRGEHTEELEQRLSKMSILVLERYAKDNNIKASTELRKEEIIEYILSNAKETKEAYYVPSSAAVYEVEHEAEVVDEEVILDVALEPVTHKVHYLGLKDVTVLENELLKKPEDPVKEGYTFDGWYKDEALEELWNFSHDVVLEEMTLYPKWKEETIENYNVYFLVNGELYKEYIVTKHGHIKSPEVILGENEVFDGWYKEEDLLNKWNFKEDIILGETTLYGKVTLRVSEDVVKPVVVSSTLNLDALVQEIKELKEVIANKDFGTTQKATLNEVALKLLTEDDDNLSPADLDLKDEKTPVKVASKECKKKNPVVKFFKGLFSTLLTLIIFTLMLLLFVGIYAAIDPNNAVINDIIRVFDHIKIGGTGIATHINWFTTWLMNLFK